MLRITLWGTRGTVPVPGSGTTLYGGNTPCVEVEAGPHRRRIVLDAGTGARLLGLRLGTEAPRTEPTALFLTHFHWDHIQGFPFLLRPLAHAAALEVMAPAVNSGEVERTLGVLMAPQFFPLTMEELGGRVGFRALQDSAESSQPRGTEKPDGELREGWSDGGVWVRWMRVCHTAPTFAYRIEEGGTSVVYAPDNELSGEGLELDREWRSRFLRFVQGADLLIHDGMYTAEELEARRGWGHSSMEEVVDFAAKGNVGRLLLFHHSPERSDHELAARENSLRGRAADLGARARVAFAVEGRKVELTPTRVSAGAPPRE